MAQRAAKQLVPQPYLGEGETRIDFQAHLAERTRATSCPWSSLARP